MSAGDNLVITLPDSEAELKASVEPAPPAGKSLTFFGWQSWGVLSQVSTDHRPDAFFPQHSK